MFEYTKSFLKVCPFTTFRITLNFVLRTTGTFFWTKEQKFTPKIHKKMRQRF